MADEKRAVSLLRAVSAVALALSDAAASGQVQVWDDYGDDLSRIAELLVGVVESAEVFPRVKESIKLTWGDEFPAIWKEVKAHV